MALKLEYDRLRKVVEQAAAIRRVQKLQPVGGPGDKVFPATYPGNGDNAQPGYVLERRRIEGRDVLCVLLDSVQSQANRLEECLLAAARSGRLPLPYIAVDFSDQTWGDGSTKIALGDLGEITSLDAPHRVFDAIIRDSQLEDGTKFTDSDYYKRLVAAKPTNALPVFELSPTSLLFGAWNSYGQGGGLGARFTRCIVSEIVGVGVPEGEVNTKKAVRVDPLGISSDVKVVVPKNQRLDWRVANPGERAQRGEEIKKPSEIGHSNIIAGRKRPALDGVAIDYALHTAVISFAGLRRLRFPDGRISKEDAGRALLAALGLAALLEQDARGYSLRSRCDLVPQGDAAFEIVHLDGSVQQFSLTGEEAESLFETAVDEAKKAGFPWRTEPLRLRPQPRLVQLVALSREKALRGEGEAEDGSGGER